MNFKTTYVLFGLLIVVLGIFLVTQLVGKKGSGASEFVFPTLNAKTAEVKAKDIETVEIDIHRPKPEKVVLTRTGDGWRMKEPNARADSAAVGRMVQQVMEAKINDKAEVSKDPKQHGLEPPEVIVNLIQKGGEKKWTLNIGNVGIGGQDALVFVTSSDRPKEILGVPRRQINELFKGPDVVVADPESRFKSGNDYRSRDLLGANPNDIQAVSLEGTKSGPLVLKKTATIGNQWMFEKPPYGEADYQGEVAGHGREGMQKGGVHELLNNLTALRVESPQDFVADDVKDLSKYGLDDKSPERIRIEVKTQNILGGDEKKEPTTTVLLLGKKTDDRKPDPKDPKAPTVEDKYFATLDEGDKYPKAVVKVSGKVRDQIYQVLENPTPLRTKDLITIEPGKLDKIDWIDVNNGRESFQLRQTGAGSWDLIDKAGNVHKADGNTVVQLLFQLMDKRTIKEYPDAKKTDAELGFDRPAAVVSFWIEGQKQTAKKEEEKKDPKTPEKDDKKPTAPTKPEGAPAVTLKFGNKDGKNVYVLREMGKDIVRAAVSEDLLNKASVEKLAYFDRSLPPFPGDKVDKVVIVRGNETLELSKEEKDGKTTWRFLKPDTLAGRTAETSKVVDILRRLNFMNADKVISETATPTELEGYGLKTPTARVTVSWPVDKKTEERTYSFGKATDDKTNRVHASLSDRGWVFLVLDNILTPIKDELADTTIFTFDPEKVKRMKLTGWNKVASLTGQEKDVINLDLERKSKTDWTAKIATGKESPREFPLDPSRAEAFLRSLATLRAQRFVVLKSGSKPEHELDDLKRTLKIELTLDGEKEPIVLTVRDPKADATDKTYYGKSSNLPGDVFAVPEGLIRPVLEAPKYFGAQSTP